MTAFWLVACVDAEDGLGARPTTALDWRACSPDAGEAEDTAPQAQEVSQMQEVECATLQVPLDPLQPEGRMLELALARRRASSGDRKGIVVMNPGGPGVRGADYIESGAKLPGTLGASFDYLSWDPRGIGKSTLVQCEGDAVQQWSDHPGYPRSPSVRASLTESARALGEACGRGDVELLAHMGTHHTVADLKRIVQALGEPVHFLGYSYGSLIGQLFLERHPESLQSLTLDGVVPADFDFEENLTSQVSGLSRTFDRLAAGCAQGTLACPGGDPRQRFAELVAQPVEDASDMADGGDTGPLYVALGASLYSEAAWQALVDGIERAHAGDATDLLEIAASYGAGESDAAYLAVRCADAPAPDPADFPALANALESAHPHFGAGTVYGALPCAFWPTEATRVPAPIELPSVEVPTLVISASGDPVTPHENGARVAKHLGAPHIVIDANRHTVVGNDDCANAQFARLLHGLDVLGSAAGACEP